MEEEEQQQKQQKQPKVLLARDQPVGPKPEGTSDEDYAEYVRNVRLDRLQVDIAEGRLTVAEAVKLAAEEKRGGRREDHE
jgi:hypothetical protein